MRKRISTSFVGLSLLLVATVSPRAAETLQILGGDVVLDGPAAKRILVVERYVDGKSLGQVTQPLALQTADPKISSVEQGSLIPRANGTTTLTAEAGPLKASVQVTVRNADRPMAWSFRNHVQSVLVKGGCSSGACHGALAGKNGFRLSLRGYDAEGDYLVLTHQARGRRVNPADPGRSLILTKPTSALQHGGGKRFEVDSLEYRVLADWITDGCAAPRPNDARIESIEILPAVSIQKPETTQQMLVHARFSDGRVEDVTRWAKYAASNAEVAQVDDVGKVTIQGRGEGSITAWYLNKLVVATITVPYEPASPQEPLAKETPRNFIDELVLAKLQALRLPPSPTAADSEFLRRTFLDTIGVLPTSDETRAFLADKSPTKRDALIETLLRRPEFVDYWTYKLSDLLLVNSEKLAPAAMWSYYHWIRNHVAANTPWDEIVRQLVTAQGNTLSNGAANFFVLHQDPLELSESISQTFLGMSINCARCHNHPLEKWTNDQYFGMASLVSRVRLKDRDGEGAFAVFSAPEGELPQPLTGKPQLPRPLDAAPISFEGTDDRRITLAQWLTTPTNPYFSRAISNRIWANFLGVGLVEKVDDLRFTNPSSNEPLLTALGKHLIESKYDLRALMRTILQSNTYQRSSVTATANMADKRFYSHYYPRRMMAEVLLDSLSQVTGSPTDFPNYPAGWRAMQLPDSKIASYFLEKFGRPQRGIVCECERTNEPNMVQALHLSNGDAVNSKLKAKGNRIETLLAANTPIDKIVEEVYLSALCRFPTKSEKDAVAKLYADRKDETPRQFVEDLYWGILSSKDFLFNH